MKKLFLFILLACSAVVYGQDKKQEVAKPQITFVELGSTTCIPCKQMQPVMAAIEKKYGAQVQVVFYDVNKEENKKISEHYKVKLIPTQVFLDKDGKEFFRHQGFYPEKEIVKLLNGKGLKAGK